MSLKWTETSSSRFPFNPRTIAHSGGLCCVCFMKGWKGARFMTELEALIRSIPDSYDGLFRGVRKIAPMQTRLESTRTQGIMETLVRTLQSRIRRETFRRWLRLSGITASRNLPTHPLGAVQSRLAGSSCRTDVSLQEWSRCLAALPSPSATRRKWFRRIFSGLSSSERRSIRGAFPM